MSKVACIELGSFVFKAVILEILIEVALVAIQNEQLVVRSGCDR
jgi:hypothetical protein